MNFTKIKETSLYVYNLERAKAFYQLTLELPLIGYLPGKHAFFRAGNSVLLLFNPNDSRTKTSPPPHYGSGKQHVAFEVSSKDYEKAKAWIISRGITITDKVVWSSGKESFYFEDSEGNVLEIVPDMGIWPD
jgi:catechol 2,3-dioxygenase-like lactoylglutathione lyase family enzyme